MNDLIKKIKIKAIENGLKHGWQKQVADELNINRTQLSYALNQYRTDQASYDILEKVYEHMNR